MQKILVTGANGFIGRNLCIALEKKGYFINKVLRNTSHAALIDMVKQSDFCFHLAGEVRNQASEDDFKASNVNFTEELIEQLECNPMDILFASSVHAANPKNPYGETKKIAEDMVTHYANKVGAQAHIYRLPHMFGQGCKPNYNSVITTWIVSAINGDELVVFDDDCKMNYLYINDLINTLIEQIKSKETLRLPETFDVKLGELKALINNVLTGKDIIRNDQFVLNLSETIAHYKTI